VLLVAGILVEEEKVLLVSRFPVEKEMMLLGSGTLDEVERMVLSSGALVGSWFFWNPFSLSELNRAGGHWYLMIGHSWSWPICQFAVITTKISSVRI
jgi:hypothetical protein